MEPETYQSNAVNLTPVTNNGIQDQIHSVVNTQQDNGQIQPHQPAIANAPLQNLAVSSVHNPGEQADAQFNIVLPSMANDVDLIEKEWVNKVKEMIQSNNNDPYTQSRLLSVAKSDYMQKRYNRIIKPLS